MRRYRLIHQIGLLCALSLWAVQSWGHTKTDLITAANGDQITGNPISSRYFSPLLHRTGKSMQGGNRLRPVHARVGNTLAIDQIVFVNHVLSTRLDKAL
jgi:hypothetical protein